MKCESCEGDVTNYRFGCPQCGAPVCCKRCCDENTAYMKKTCMCGNTIDGRYSCDGHVPVSMYDYQFRKKDADLDVE